MLTPAKAAANKRNAARSTGPKSPAGKAISRQNAFSHGLRAVSPVVPGEDPAEWEAFRDAVVSDLAPVGAVETLLAERVALMLWKLRRVNVYEAAIVTQLSDEAAQQVRGEDRVDALWFTPSPTGAPTVASLRRQCEELTTFIANGERLAPLLHSLTHDPAVVPVSGEDAVFALDQVAELLTDEDGETTIDPTDPDFLSALGVPVEVHDWPEVWGGWTVDLIRRGVALVASSVRGSARQLLAHATANCAAGLERHRAELAARRRELKAAERSAKVDEAAARRRALVAKNAVDVVVKYDGHFQRQMMQALHELERRQAFRSDCPPHPPAVLDVTVHADEEGVATLLPIGG
jgi:hypothetical protein